MSLKVLPVLMLIIPQTFSSISDQNVLDRPKRQNFVDPKSHLDAIIDHQLFSIRQKIFNSIDVAEKNIRLVLAKRETQGWSIVIASWKDIAADYVTNNRSASSLGVDVIYKYGFLASYGVGFGFPLLLGLPDAQLGCGQNDFDALANEYGVSNGISPLVGSYTKAEMESVVGEFAIQAPVALKCILDRSGDEIEAAEVDWALQELVTAMELRTSLE